MIPRKPAEGNASSWFDSTLDERVAQGTHRVTESRDRPVNANAQDSAMDGTDMGE